MSVALLDSVYFNKKLQDLWALLLGPSFSCWRNFRTLAQSNSVFLFFVGAFLFHNFSINSTSVFFQGTALTSIFFSFVVRTW